MQLLRCGAVLVSSGTTRPPAQCAFSEEGCVFSAKGHAFSAYGAACWRRARCGACGVRSVGAAAWDGRRMGLGQLGCGCGAAVARRSACGRCSGTVPVRRAAAANRSVDRSLQLDYHHKYYPPNRRPALRPRPPPPLPRAHRRPPTVHRARSEDSGPGGGGSTWLGRRSRGTWEYSPSGCWGGSALVARRQRHRPRQLPVQHDCALRRLGRVGQEEGHARGPLGPCGRRHSARDRRVRRSPKPAALTAARTAARTHGRACNYGRSRCNHGGATRRSRSWPCNGDVSGGYPKAHGRVCFCSFVSRFLKVLVIGGMDTTGKGSDRVYE